MCSWQWVILHLCQLYKLGLSSKASCSLLIMFWKQEGRRKDKRITKYHAYGLGLNLGCNRKKKKCKWFIEFSVPNIAHKSSLQSPRALLTSMLFILSAFLRVHFASKTTTCSLLITCVTNKIPSILMQGTMHIITMHISSSRMWTLVD